MAIVSEELVEQFAEELGGSGINYTWKIEETKTSFRASNSFDTMDEAGGYDTPAPFTVIFTKGDEMKDFKLQFNGEIAQRMNTKYVLRDYLEDTIAYAIEDLS